MLQIFVGIDPSITSTGLVALDETGKLMTATSIKSKPVKGGDWHNVVVRRETMVRTIIAFLGGYNSFEAHVLIEDYSGLRYVKGAIPTVELGATLRSGLYQWESKRDNATVEFISASTLKKFVTGKGNADKAQMADAIHADHHILLADDDQYDAFGLAQFVRVGHGFYGAATAAQIALTKCLKHGYKDENHSLPRRQKAEIALPKSKRQGTIA